MLSLSKHSAALIAALAIAPPVNYAPTPQLAAANVVAHASDRHQPQAVRTNIAGRFAVVHVRGGSIEGEPIDDALLLEHFDFGWQPLETVGDPCALARYGIDAATSTKLLAGVPRKHNARGCDQTTADIGSPADVAAVRRLMTLEFVPAVIIHDGYALGMFDEPGGGQVLFRKAAHGWIRLVGGGGAISVKGMADEGVPLRIACEFPVMRDAACPTSPVTHTDGGPLINYAATPEQAAQNVVGAPGLQPFRANIVGPYAVVETRGGNIENGPPPKLTLLELFSFGWQAVDFVQDQCALAPRGIDAPTATALLNGMPRLAHNVHGCAASSYPPDRGTPADTTAIRHSEQQLLIPNVTVAGTFAISEWFGAGGGQHLYRKSAQGWEIVPGIGGGGELDATQVVGKGVPLRDACALPVQHDIVCQK